MRVGGAHSTIEPSMLLIERFFIINKRKSVIGNSNDVTSGSLITMAGKIVENASFESPTCLEVRSRVRD